ncbi:Hypothetical protein ORPV_568 [Orpheovirus IHUMI-LCC2]|uniref:Uncharacterized protein n=1 Tax=Orpheovirus IHUMI-LCC2 TaxID=2023057 RepID=A0A2I2L4J8_9VIRU|nr:Hypothetical protein ORPV_568 [Orpheovirus IHUMI-LCC2]SNW62472.1 Hypothetical protein ORPV_568 [Orpheovirus IHUMI-LCC2]
MNLKSLNQDVIGELSSYLNINDIRSLLLYNNIPQLSNLSRNKVYWEKYLNKSTKYGTYLISLPTQPTNYIEYISSLFNNNMTDYTNYSWYISQSYKINYEDTIPTYANIFDLCFDLLIMFDHAIHFYVERPIIENMFYKLQGDILTVTYKSNNKPQNILNESQNIDNAIDKEYDNIFEKMLNHHNLLTNKKLDESIYDKYLSKLLEKYKDEEKKIKTKFPDINIESQNNVNDNGNDEVEDLTDIPEGLKRYLSMSRLEHIKDNITKISTEWILSKNNENASAEERKSYDIKNYESIIPFSILETRWYLVSKDRENELVKGLHRISDTITNIDDDEGESDLAVITFADGSVLEQYLYDSSQDYEPEPYDYDY